MGKNKTSRREFLKTLAAGTCGAAVHRMLAPAAGFFALARPLEAMAAGDRVLVIVNLGGGCSHNIAPILHSAYYDRNPNVSYQPGACLPITGDQGLHPSLTSLKTVYDAGNLAVCNLVGYASPNRSHDESSNIFWTGARMPGATTEGWGARLTSQMQAAFGGISLAGANAFVKGGTNPPRVVQSLTNFGVNPLFYDTAAARFSRDTSTVMLIDDDPANTEAKEHTRSSVVKLEGNLDSLQAVGSTTLPVTFPNTGMGNRFSDAAKLIKAGPTLGVRVIYIEQGGYDTHAGEKAAQTARLTELNGGLSAFIQCMQAMGRWQDVVVSTMTEFTRTMENNSQGTDHGAAGPLLICGGSIKGGQKGTVATAADVQDEYIRAKHFNFSQIYGEAVSWMGFDAAKVFPYPELSPSPYLGLF